MSEPQTFLDGRVVLHAGDCLDVMDRLEADSVDAVVTDPPYHFDTIVERFGAPDAAPAKSNGATGVFGRASAGFMGKTWDGGDIAFRPETWAKVLRVLKPGGHMAAFSAPKCVHKMAWGIEAAGFEIRDRALHLIDVDEHVIAFLESLSVAQAEALFRLLDHFGPLGEAFWTFGSGFPKNHDVAKAIDKLKGAKRRVVGRERINNDIRGAALLDAAHDGNRPGFEREITEATSPEAKQWQGWGTALKPSYEPIVIARKPVAESSVARQVMKTGTGALNIDAGLIGTEGGARSGRIAGPSENTFGNGLNGGGALPTGKGRWPANLSHDGAPATIAGFPTDGDAGASRFFYSAKANAADRIGTAHPTVKPLDLMQWLCRMMVPPGGTVLDLFAGTGATGEAAFREGFNAVLIEREEEYRADIARRMAVATAGPRSRRHAGLRAKAERRAQTEGAAPANDDASPIADMFGQRGGGAGRER